MLQQLRSFCARPCAALRVIVGSLVGILALGPARAYAAGSEAVDLKFTRADLTYLWISLGFGIIAIVSAFFIGRWVLAQVPGDEKMQQVGQAIREGALAYLLRQIKTMIFFIVPLAFLLAWIFHFNFGWLLATYLALSFIGGVSASYIAGFAGMIMAVSANMRTAAAALTGPKRALEIAFRSGAVAGLLTVGMGLIGATLIFLLAGNDAMKLLIGFGFGGSLAALFMRVGGGIYTKAADVGADLVGKVEAGIPEDDPRNAATIADNVGDNVGDCAGMAADVFESYEVTLVAAIVLGAATAAIFDQATWMKLIIFALMARGVGILASIVGILWVRGSTNVDADALKPLRKGFAVSAVVAALGTLALAWHLMGGPRSGSATIRTVNLISLEETREKEYAAIRSVRDELALKRNVPKWQVTYADVQAELKKQDEALEKEVRERLAKSKGIAADKVERKDIELDPEFRARAWGLGNPEHMSTIQIALPTPRTAPSTPERLEGFSRVDLDDPDNLAKRYTTTIYPRSPGEQTRYVSLEEAIKDEKLAIYYLRVRQEATTTEEGQQLPAMDQMMWYGPITEKEFNRQVEVAKNSKVEVEVYQTYPVALYAHPDGKFVLAVEGNLPKPHRNIRLAPPLPTGYFKETPEVVRKAMDERANPRDFASPVPVPTEEPLPVVVAEIKEVPWHLFFWAILFGIFMAFAIELLTDYYVSTHKRPVKEVAGVATTGPAPMIIQGFALAAESSVFSVFSIVVALLVPLFLFNPLEYGSPILSFYGIALVGLGLLTTTGYILAMDTFGPISDNAQGVFEMSGAGRGNALGSKAVQRLDAAGNTTKALTKGFAIATAVVAAVALFHSYIEDAQLTFAGLKLEVPEIFLGLLIGGAAPYLFSASTINAVGRAAFDLINEVRRQFRSDPGIMAGTSKPNYGACVEIVTGAAQRELIGPGILAIALPMAVAFGFSIGKDPVRIGDGTYVLAGAQALGGFLAGAILSGQLLAVLLANAGGIWDNAKKLIEDGLHGGKGTDAHKAGVVVDTVGDPFKDTAGPALNPLIKVMNLVALLLAPVVIQPREQWQLYVITGACLLALAFSIWWSKRSTMSSALQATQRAEPELPAGKEGVLHRKRIAIEEPEGSPPE